MQITLQNLIQQMTMQENGLYITMDPFLNPEDVKECFVYYFMTDKPKNPAITEFCDYLVDNYL